MPYTHACANTHNTHTHTHTHIHTHTHTHVCIPYPSVSIEEVYCRIAFVIQHLHVHQEKDEEEWVNKTSEELCRPCQMKTHSRWSWCELDQRTWYIHMQQPSEQLTALLQWAPSNRHDGKHCSDKNILCVYYLQVHWEGIGGIYGTQWCFCIPIETVFLAYSVYLLLTCNKAPYSICTTERNAHLVSFLLFQSSKWSLHALI